MAKAGRKANGQFKKRHKKPRAKKPAARRARKRNPGTSEPVILMNPDHRPARPRRRRRRAAPAAAPAPARRRRRRRKNPEGMGTVGKVAIGLGAGILGAAVGTVASQALEAKSTMSSGANSAIEVLGGLVIGTGLCFLSLPLGISFGLSTAAPALGRVGGALVGVAAPALPATPPASAPKAAAFMRAGFSGMGVDIGGMGSTEGRLAQEARQASTPLRSR